MMPPSLAFLLAASAALVGPARLMAADAPLQSRFEQQVRRYEQADRANPPPKGAILLAGDSQFFRWKTLTGDLPDYTVINRGIDSFQLSDVIHYADRIVLPYQPRLIVLHVGGNDVHNGKSAAQIVADLKTFVSVVHGKYPHVPIIFSSLTPGPGRWDEADRRRETNRVIQEYVGTQPNLKFLDLWSAMLTPDGKPRDDIWVADRVHPNHEGYLIRVRLMRPLLGPPDRPTAKE